MVKCVDEKMPSIAVSTVITFEINRNGKIQPFVDLIPTTLPIDKKAKRLITSAICQISCRTRMFDILTHRVTDIRTDHAFWQHLSQ